ncbi:MAG: ABC transporter permease [Acidobacteriaceae bacterium]|nr:ABC transporter permease [Acidobacteriaceae bacterium]MBV9778748.1 ABC transporter permease [Acidobacteriaceae bacterium]
MRFFKRRPAETQLDSELRYHIERLIEEKVAAGLTRDQAHREAMLDFGGREQIKEDLRDVHRFATLENTIANLRSGIRLIRKSPSFSAAVILTLALGIGANTAVFSAIDAILLRPLPFPESDELILVRQHDLQGRVSNIFVAPPRLEDWNRLNTTFQAISGWYLNDGSETSGALPEKITTALVAPRFLQVWGVSPVLGRDFTREEEHWRT